MKKNCCLDRGLLEATGELVGKGKSAKATYRITPEGIAFVLENGEIPTLLKDLLLVNDGQRETLQQLQTALGRVSQAMTCQNELLGKLQEKVKAPNVTTAAVPTGSSNGQWLATAFEYVKQFRRQHAHRSCPFSELFENVAKPAGVTIGQFHDGLRRLSNERRISLRPWTGALSDLKDDHLALVLAKETKYTANAAHRLMSAQFKLRNRKNRQAFFNDGQ